MENKNGNSSAPINKTGNTIEVVKYPVENINNILKYINDTPWNKTNVLDLMAFIRDIRQILAEPYDITTEDVKKEGRDNENPGFPHVDGEIVE